MDATRRHYSPTLVWPFVLIGAGIVAILVNTGAISWDSLGRIAGLWPVLLILVGAELIISRSFPAVVALPTNLAISAVALIGLLALLVSGASWPIGSWLPGASTQTITRTAPLPDASQAHLEMNYGAAALTIHSGDLNGNLYQAHLTYAGSPAPSVWVDKASGTVHVDRGNRSPFQIWPLTTSEKVDLVLSNRIAWSVDVNAGASQQTLDLRGLSLTSFKSNGGATGMEIDLPSAKGTVPVRVNGGAMGVRLVVPQDADLRVTTSGGANSLHVDGQQLSGIGQQSWQSPGYGQATDRFDIQFSGGASSLTVERW